MTDSAPSPVGTVAARRFRSRSRWWQSAQADGRVIFSDAAVGAESGAGVSGDAPTGAERHRAGGRWATATGLLCLWMLPAAGLVPAIAAEPASAAADTPVPAHGVLHLGRPALDAEIAAWDIDIRPDGEGLPSGSGSVTTGGELYDSRCASCHGVFGEGEGRWPMLAGGLDTLTDERPEKTIGSYWPYLSTVYDYIRRAMPYGNARSLSDDDVYAITAYLLYMNDIVDEDFTLDTDSFGTVTMPNADGFIADTRSEEAWFDQSAEPCMSDCIDGEASVSMRARVLDVTPDGDGGGDAEDGGGLD